MRIVSTKSEISQILEVLREGGLIVYPTETCYGVGVDVTNQKAVNKLLQYKERPEGKAISIAVANGEMAEKYVEVNETAVNLYKNFLPGPVTVISSLKRSIDQKINRSKKIAQGIAAEDGSLGIRIPDYPFTLELIKAFGKPITATSANMSGHKTPYKIEDVLNNIPEKKKELIDLIIDAGELPHNPPSTVVDTRLNDEKILREGSISFKNHAHKSHTTHISHSEEETQQLGEKLMKELIPKLKNKSIIFALQGDLGAGKTQFAKGVARTLRIKENVTSPTFTIVKEYKFNLGSHPEQSEGSIKSNHIDSSSRLGGTQNDNVFYHIDTWRMEKESELKDLGFEKMIQPGNVVVIEWVEKISTVFKTINENIVIELIRIIDKDGVREIEIVRN